jgi:ABC-2 type transport system ATP-binding protein
LKEKKMKKPVVTVRALRKVYGSLTAVGEVSFEVYRGEIFGLLGPNGAGKTTTFECLEGLRKPDEGEMDILGVDPIRETGKLYELIGVQLQTSGLPPNMTVAEAMKFICAYHRVEPRFDLLERLGLEEKLADQYSQLSVGQQRRLSLALAIAHSPPLILLDEPTAGLDVGSRVTLHAIMRELKEEGITILLATHDMAEAEKMADRVAILLRGAIVAEGTPRELTTTGSGLTKVSVRTEQDILHHDGTAFPGVAQKVVKDEYAVYFTSDPGPTVSAILDYLKLQDDKLIDLRVERPSLEERFLEITNTGAVR